MSLDAQDTSARGGSSVGPRSCAGQGSAAQSTSHHRRHRRSNNIYAGLHQNSATGRRIVDLTRDYMQQLGNPSSLTQQAAIVAAVELQVLSEVARAAALEATPPTMDMLDQVVRLEASVMRATRKLGLDKQPPRKPDGPLLDTYLASKREAAP